MKSIKSLFFAGLVGLALSSCNEQEFSSDDNQEDAFVPRAFKTIYGVSEPTMGNSILYTINYSTGATTVVGNIMNGFYQVNTVRAIAQRKSDSQLYVITGSNSTNYPGRIFRMTTSGNVFTQVYLYKTTVGTYFNVGDAEFDPGNGDLYMTEYGTSQVYKMTAAQLSAAESSGSYTITSSNSLTNTNVAGIVGETYGHQFGLAFDLSANLYICNQSGSKKAKIDKTSGNIIGSVCTNSITDGGLQVGMCFTGGKFIVRYNHWSGLSYLPRTITYSSICTASAAGTSGVSNISDITAVPDVCPGCE